MSLLLLPAIISMPNLIEFKQQLEEIKLKPYKKAYPYLPLFFDCHWLL